MVDRIRMPARRSVLAALAGLPFLGMVGTARGQEGLPRRPEAPGPALRYGPARPFRYETLVARAEALARRPDRPPAERYAEQLARIGYDEHQQILMRRELAPRTAASPVAIDLFHMANFFRLPVAMHLVEAGSAREILYSSRVFAFGEAARFAAALPDDLGYAGFRLRNADTWEEWLSFLGSSYFRSPGEQGRFGLSARGLAVNTAMPGGEEFPRFSAFWLEPRAGREDRLTIYALLESARVAGAYRIDARHGRGTTMDVEAALFLRGDVGRLGIAPLTSMYWYGKHDRRQRSDWRPEVHDSDGLALWTATGERIWRPLINPPRPSVSLFRGRPKGFGLLQRERRFAQYEDPLTYYDRRPSLWVEPTGDWGAGALHLVELPAESEFNDNIVAFWVADRPATAGSAMRFAYRLHWLSDQPFPPPMAQVTATRTGTSGVHDPRSTKFAVDFEGGSLDRVEIRADGSSALEFAVSAPRGKIERNHVMPIDDARRWRAIFEYAPADEEPVDLRGSLRRGGEALSETWAFRFVPRA
jgi:glucans biosynthesis protein